MTPEQAVEFMTAWEGAQGAFMAVVCVLALSLGVITAGKV